MKLVYLIFLQEMADHAHPAAVWCSVEQSLIDGTVEHTCELVFKPEVDVLNIGCECVTINLFSLYLMNLMLHTMLDAVVLRVHYKV